MGRIFEFLSQTSDGAFAVDSEQRIVFWNAAAEQLLGWKAKEVVGKLCHDVIRGRDAAGRPTCEHQCRTMRRAMRQKSTPAGEVRSQTRENHPVWLSVSTIVVPSSWEELSVLIHLFRDVSSAKELERSMQTLFFKLGEFCPSEIASSNAAAAEAESDSLPSWTFKDLTTREREVLQQLAAGASTHQMCERLFISKATVRNHIHSILSKLGVHTRLEAVTLGLRNGLLESSSSSST